MTDALAQFYAVRGLAAPVVFGASIPVAILVHPGVAQRLWALLLVVLPAIRVLMERRLAHRLGRPGRPAPRR